MFDSARIKLTVWYLFIITLISASFSVAIYRVLSSEIDRIERVQLLRFDRGFPVPLIDPDIIAEAKRRLQFELVMINLGIVCSSAVAGYFLAGRTLQPIKQMVDGQNRFISDASHELRTPLTVLKSEIEVNLRDKNLTLTDARQLLKSNLEEVNNLQNMSDDLIKLSRFQSGDSNLVFAPVSLPKTVEDAVKKVSRLAGNKHITIKNDVSACSLLANKNTLTELWVIFLDNSIKYSPANTEIKFTSEKSGKYVLVHISDQGQGVSEEEQQKIFERFYRSDKSRSKSDVKGYGLGLSIAKQIVDRHQGTITLVSYPNRGTTFTVKLPLNPYD